MHMVVNISSIFKRLMLSICECARVCVCVCCCARGVRLYHFQVKRIVFISMPNRNESHLFHCINPGIGFSFGDTRNTVFFNDSSLFRRPFRFASSFFHAVLHLSNDFHRWSLWTVCFFSSRFISLDCLFDHEHKLIWYSFSWKCA